MSRQPLRRPKIPYDVQVRVFFNDKWLCRWCGRPTVFPPALKYMKQFLEDKGYSRPTAFHSFAYRRDASPLLDEMAAVVDHVKAHVDGGPSTEDNLGTACNRCNMRKSSDSKDRFTMRNPKRHIKAQYGEPEHWDGFVSFFMVLARDNEARLTVSERSWYRSFTKFFTDESSKGASGADQPGLAAGRAAGR